jgi:NAD-specific glutamate dehydrogenase
MHSSTTVLPKKKYLHEIVVNGVNITAYIREFYFGPINRGGLRMGGDR